MIDVYFFFGNREATILRLVVRTVLDHPYLSKASRTSPLLCLSLNVAPPCATPHLFMCVCVCNLLKVCF